MATFCVGPNYRDGLDGPFCSNPSQPATAISLQLSLGGGNNAPPLATLNGSGPWNETVNPVNTLTAGPVIPRLLCFWAHLLKTPDPFLGTK